MFIGWNGAGKSSVLEAIANSVKFYLQGDRFPINESDIKLESKKSRVFLSGYSGKYSITQGSELRYAQNGNKEEYSRLLDKPNEPAKEFNKVLRRQFAKGGSQLDIPILMYYPTNRIVPKSPSVGYDKESDKELHQIDAWRNNLQSVQDYTGFFRWFRIKEDVENEKRLRENSSFRERGLTAVRDAIKESFPEFQSLYIRRTPKEAFVVQKSGTEEVFSMTQLSDGEKGVIVIIADIARRLEMANPTLENPLQGKGIVLIDEIELHLHPAWQRRIVPALEKTFPGIQFILTTHSPQVVSEIARSQVFLLENFKVIKEVPHTLGRDSNTLLQDVFNVPERPEAAKEEFDKLYRILDNPRKKEEAKGLLREMSQKYGADDPEIQRATLHYEFMNEA